MCKCPKRQRLAVDDVPLSLMHCTIEHYWTVECGFAAFAAATGIDSVAVMLWRVEQSKWAYYSELLVFVSLFVVNRVWLTVVENS